MAALTIWSLILNRKDKLLQSFWTEWRANVVTSSTGAADAGAIPMLDPQGQIDPSMIPGGGGGGGGGSVGGYFALNDGTFLNGSSQFTFDDGGFDGDGDDGAFDGDGDA